MSKPHSMALRDGDKASFGTLLKAANNGDLALISAIRKSDGVKVALVVATGYDSSDATRYPAPLAVMVEGNPFALFEDPTKEYRHGI